MKKILFIVLAIITLSLIFPILVWGSIVVGVEILNASGTLQRPIDFKSEAFLIALLGKWLVFMAFTCITLLCSVIFMETTKTLGSAGLIVGGSWILERFGGLIRTASAETADIIQGISLFHYLEGTKVMNGLINNENFDYYYPVIELDLSYAYPFPELVLVLAIGIGALLLALFLFQKRQFTYI
ncbi:MAG: hypothetical protein JSU57_05675 [Candidatus Heimdallarchaeota archaeon]|nr:MAG: hypothetical protein JSU57_05675 [Candidatus Heimdallarchaeota archaeon]